MSSAPYDKIFVNETKPTRVFVLNASSLEVIFFYFGGKKENIVTFRIGSPWNASPRVMAWKVFENPVKSNY